jgi:hypothetical protein
MACSTSLFTASRLKLAGACIGGNSMAVWANLATSCGDQVQALSALSRGNRDRENCECHAGSSGRYHFCHAGNSCDTDTGKCHR